MKEKLPSPPIFDTPEDEDEFWQTHSPLDFEHEDSGIPAPRKFSRPKSLDRKTSKGKMVSKTKK